MGENEMMAMQKRMKREILGSNLAKGRVRDKISKYSIEPAGDGGGFGVYVSQKGLIIYTR